MNTRHFLDLSDLSQAEIRHVLEVGSALKAKRRRGERATERPLEGKVLAMVDPPFPQKVQDATMKRLLARWGVTLGDNLIAFAATDNFPVYGYNHAAWLQIDGLRAAAVPEPAPYALVLAALAATALMPRRRKSQNDTEKPIPVGQ